MVDKDYLMRKEFNISDAKLKRGEIYSILYNELVNSQKGKLTYEVKTQLRSLIQQFLNDPFDSHSLVDQKTADGFMTMPKSAYKKLLKIYMQNMYTVEKPTEGRAYRNNKIVDMYYEVLTHETAADKVLNPGGFEQQKRMGYMVSAFKSGAKDPVTSRPYTWEELSEMPVKELKGLSSSSDNLADIDVQTQFYKQNSAASTLTGVFAVNRIAHAVLESGSADGSATYYIDADAACGFSGPEEYFSIAGMKIGGTMPFDMRYDRNGQLIGKTLGSLVASSVDAVKDPVLNLMDINGITSNVLNALLRIGLPFETAALFLSQPVIAKVLDKFSRDNVLEFKSLSTVIDEVLEEIKVLNFIDSSSALTTEDISFDELVKGLRDNPETTQYKVLRAYKYIQNIANALRMPTYATRFNSINSSVGPLIVDNLIIEHKLQQGMNSFIVDAKGNMVTIQDIFNNHPILNQFKEAAAIARTTFGNMPANSIGFRKILDCVDATPLSNTILNNRSLLSKLSDFYQSYLAIKGGIINASELRAYIEKFPQTFLDRNYKKQYPDNPLIQSIKYSIDTSKRLVLKLDTTGMDMIQKERLSSAWADLHAKDPKLSTSLFKYCFFRGGMGFNFKSFMNLVPVAVKEQIPAYIDTFRKLPEVDSSVVLDQFIRNNWDNNRLVPYKKVDIIRLRNGNFGVAKPNEAKVLKNAFYFKTRYKGRQTIFRMIQDSYGDNTGDFVEVQPLGSNGEYIEMSESNIDNPVYIPANTRAPEKSEYVSDMEGDPQEEIRDSGGVPYEELAHKYTDEELNNLLFKALIMDNVTKEIAQEHIKDYKSKSFDEQQASEGKIKKFLENRFDTLGIKYNEELIDKVYKKIC